MRYLFIVQGEGRGHLTQAIALSRLLRRNGHEVVEVLAGRSSGRQLPGFFTEKIGAPVRIFESPDFCFTKNNKRVRLARTLVYNASFRKLLAFGRSLELIHRRIAENRPDVVVNFYELLAPLARLRFREQVPFVSLAHQFLIDHPDDRHGKGSSPGELLLRLTNEVCALGASKVLALSFYPLPPCPERRMTVVPPLLRPEVAALKPCDEGFLLGYMLNAGYEEEVRAWHARHPETELHLFWDKPDAPVSWKVDDTLTFHRIDDTLFLQYMAACSGYVTTAGFESVCEAMYLGKPAMLIPVHVEQEINAADAVASGAGIVSDRFDMSRLLDYRVRHTADPEPFRKWVASAESVFLKELTTGF